MICPHCKGPINYIKHTTDLKKSVLKLHKEGFSARDIEAKLERAVSFSTAARWIREAGR